MNTPIQIAAGIGLILSAYLYSVDRKLAKNSEYHAVCDISNKISCTAVTKSPFSKMFGVPNALLGILFYAFIMGAAYLQLLWAVLIASVAAVILDIYLFYIMHTRIKKYCIACIATYAVNLAILLLSYTAA